MPKISVCIPTFNRAHLLPFAIESVLQQTQQDWELIVCDDGSHDNTFEVMSTYQDERIRYIRHPINIGKSNNMRSGFGSATGEYFLKFDDDDRLTPEFLERTSEILDLDPKIDFVGTDHWLIDTNNQRLTNQTEANSRKWGRTELAEGIPEDLLTLVFVKQSFQIGATLFRRQALSDISYMRPNIQNCEDNDLLVRLALANKTGYYLPQRLMEYRVHAEQQSIDREISYLKDKVQYLEGFEFVAQELEEVRRSRLAETQLLLGLRLIEKGNIKDGRTLLQAGRFASMTKFWVGFSLSFFPNCLRQKTFTWLRQPKSHKEPAQIRAGHTTG